MFAFYSTEARNEVQNQHHRLRKLTKSAQIDRYSVLQLKIIIETKKRQLIAILWDQGEFMESEGHKRTFLASHN